MKQKLQPNLRFPEFEGEWEMKKLGEVMKFKVTNSFSRENLNYEKGVVKNIHYGDIHTKFQTLFDITKESVPFVNEEISIGRISEENYCKEGDIIFADASEDINDVGKSIEIKNLNSERLLSGLHTLLGRPMDSKFIIGFNGYLFKSNNIRLQIQKESQDSKVLSINVGRILGINLSFPSSLPEQTKIASFLTAVDNKLHALKQKHALLEQYKKGVMQQLFSGKLRFKDENGNDYPDWEEKRLGEVAEKRIIKNRDNKINLVFTNSAVQGIVNQRDFFDKDIANQNNLLGYYIVEKDDFVYNPRISTNAPVGPISRNHLDTGIMSPLYSVFRFKYGNFDFIEYFFNSSVWHLHMKNISNYGARDDRMSFSTSDFYKMPIPFPCNKEQQKIANFLSSLVAKIESTTQQITQTQTFKKGLLQKMFV